MTYLQNCVLVQEPVYALNKQQSPHWRWGYIVYILFSLLCSCIVVFTVSCWELGKNSKSWKCSVLCLNSQATWRINIHKHKSGPRERQEKLTHTELSASWLDFLYLDNYPVWLAQMSLPRPVQGRLALSHSSFFGRLFLLCCQSQGES